MSAVEGAARVQLHERGRPATMTLKHRITWGLNRSSMITSQVTNCHVSKETDGSEIWTSDILGRQMIDPLSHCWYGFTQDSPLVNVLIDWLPRPSTQPLSVSENSAQRSRQSVGMYNKWSKYLNLFGFNAVSKGRILRPSTEHLTCKWLRGFSHYIHPILRD